MGLDNAFWQDYILLFVELNATAALNDVMMSYLVLHVSNTKNINYNGCINPNTRDFM